MGNNDPDKETYKLQIKANVEMETKLEGIANRSRENSNVEFNWLIQHVTKENLTSCFHELDGKKAVGVDGISKEEYGKNLDANFEALIERMKKMTYRPGPVREVLIPKSNGKMRPLGISNFEDKIVQKMFSKILEAIYDPIFSETSFGFRPKRGCHDAIKDLHAHLGKKWDGMVIDLDLSNFFGTIDHRKLIQLLEVKIKDRVFIRYIVRMLKSGVLKGDELRMSDDGTPQGSVVSPILANIFAHYAIDRWIEIVVSRYTQDEIHFVRYADDIVICASNRDAPRVMKALKGRLKRFSLKLNEEKTKVVDFSRKHSLKGSRQGTFHFLGFTFYIGRSRKGAALVKIKTSSKTFSAKLKEITTWCFKFKNRYRLGKLWKIFNSKLRGHIAYYGVSHNFESVRDFLHCAERIFFKWINRRSQRRSFVWQKFSLFTREFPMPRARIVHRLF